jgi:hypothetical protein
MLGFQEGRSKNKQMGVLKWSALSLRFFIELRSIPGFFARPSANTFHSSPVFMPLRIDSTGRNCICLCGWLAPECSPELKKPNSSSPFSRYAFRHS